MACPLWVGSSRFERSQGGKWFEIVYLPQKLGFLHDRTIKIDKSPDHKQELSLGKMVKVSFCQDYASATSLISSGPQSISICLLPRIFLFFFFFFSSLCKFQLHPHLFVVDDDC